LNAILRGSDATSKQAKDRFLDQLENYLKEPITKLYAPEQIMRRNKEVDPVIALDVRGRLLVLRFR
jgi:hypothetical protein